MTAYTGKAGLVVGLIALGISACGGGGVAMNPPPNPAPRITSLGPSGAYAGFGGFPLTVDGSGFISSSAIQWNGSNRATTFISSTRVTTIIPGSDIATAGMESVKVTNPSPGGGVSNAVTFKVAPGPAADAGVVQLVSVASDGSPGNGNSLTPPSISSTGRYVAFQSDATNLVSGPASGFADIFVRDTCTGAPAGCTPSTIRVSVASNGTLANGNSRSPSISADGRFVAFDSSATNLVAGVTSGGRQVFLRDTCTGAQPGCTATTLALSVAPDGTQGNGPSQAASIDGTGRFVAFESAATNLIAGQTDPGGAVIRDTCNGVAVGCMPSTLRVSVANDGTPANSSSGTAFTSASGRFITFLSFATNLVPGATNGQPDAFVRDTCFGAPPGCVPTTSRVSVAADGSPENGRTVSPSPISSDARFVAFTSFATNLVAGKTTPFGEVYRRDTCIGAATGCMATTIRASVAFDDTEANNGSGDPSITANGRLVAFDSLATNLIYGGSGAPKSVLLRDTCTGAPAGCISTTILLARRPTDGLGGNGQDTNPVLSADGHYAAFLSNATNLLSPVSNGNVQVFLARTGY